MLLNSQACPQPTALLLFTHTLTHTGKGSKCLLLLLRCESRLKFLLSGSLKWFCAALELVIFRECLEVPFIALIVPVLLRLLFLEMHTISFVILMSSIPLGLAKFRLVQTIYYSIDLGFYLKTLTRIKLKLRIDYTFFADLWLYYPLKIVSHIFIYGADQWFLISVRFPGFRQVFKLFSNVLITLVHLRAMEMAISCNMYGLPWVILRPQRIFKCKTNIKLLQCCLSKMRRIKIKARSVWGMLYTLAFFEVSTSLHRVFLFQMYIF